MINCAIIGIPCFTKADALRWRFLLKALSNPSSKEGSALKLLGSAYADKAFTEQDFTQLIDQARKHGLTAT